MKKKAKNLVVEGASGDGILLTVFCADCFIRIPNKQPGLSMESKAVFFVCSHIFDDGVTTRIHAPARDKL